MKSLSNYMQEKLIIKKSTSKKNKATSYKYFPKTKEELQYIISRRIKAEGNEVDLNDIDTSNITDMSSLFKDTDFNGDISNWNVSKITDMNRMFLSCTEFNSDISDWDVSKVTNMFSMFFECENFNQDISGWNVSKVKNMTCMFLGCSKFNQDISKWDVSNVNDSRFMFYVIKLLILFKIILDL